MDIEILFCCEGGDQFNEYAADDDDLEEYVGELLVIHDKSWQKKWSLGAFQISENVKGERIEQIEMYEN